MRKLLPILMLVALSPVVDAQTVIIDQSTGQVIGQINTNPYAAESINNPYSSIRNPYGANSLANPYGATANPYGMNSLNNPYSVPAPTYRYNYGY